MQFRLGVLLLLVSLMTFSWSCKTVKKEWNEMNFFPVSQDVALGKEVAAEIASKPAEYPILPEASNKAVYDYVRRIMTKIRNTGLVENNSRFTWDLKIIKDDKTLNAFCTPGGHIYVYTGLIKFLDSEDQLAGVMGHEMGHAAKRHSTRQLSKSMGVQAMVEMGDYLLGSKVKDQNFRNQIKQMTSAVIGLKFSREHETEADDMSVKYLCGTDYNAAGAAGFFKKIQGKGGTPPEFLSTHPNPANRVQAIEAKAKPCAGRKTFTTEYQQIKAKL